MNNDDPYGENYLAHYGIKGMRWGSRKSRAVSRTERRARFHKKQSQRKPGSRRLARRASRAASSASKARSARKKEVVFKENFKNAAKLKTLRALKVISGTSEGGVGRKLGGVSVESMRAKGKDNVQGYLQLIGKQAVGGMVVGSTI